MTSFVPPMILPAEWEVGDTVVADDGKTFVIVAIDHEANKLTVEGNTSTGARTTFQYTDKRPNFTRRDDAA